MEVGGIYLDTDSIILKSLDRFRKFELTLFEEGPRTVGECCITFILVVIIWKLVMGIGSAWF